LLACGAGSVRAETRPLELQPYRVRIEVAFASRAALSLPRRTTVLAELEQGLDRTVGDMWQATLSEDHSLGAAVGPGLQRLREDALRSEYAPAGFDKVYRLTVEAAGAGFRAAGREWDGATGQLGPTCRRGCGDPREISAMLLALLRDLFRPVTTIEQPKRGPLTLHARAGALTPRDETWRPLTEGALYEVYYRYLNKEHAVERIQQVPWTYLAVSDASAGTAAGRVISGLRAPLTARRRRVEVMGLAVRRNSPVTRLQLVTLLPTRRPLGGVEVEVSTDDPQQADDETKTTARPGDRYVSDRNGMVTLGAEVQAAPGMVWLLVRSGQNLLARVPFVAGVRELEVMELPDDTLRLEIEGRLAQLQSELVDVVARRAVLASLARHRAKARDWPRAEESLRQLTAQKDASEFLADLNAIRLPGLQAARARKDRATELRAAKLCDELAGLIKQYLDDDKLKQVREEVAEFRAIAAEESAAERQFQRGRAESSPAVEPAASPAKPRPASPTGF
jgi:hypothetical protein